MEMQALNRDFGNLEKRLQYPLLWRLERIYINPLALNNNPGKIGHKNILSS